MNEELKIIIRAVTDDAKKKIKEVNTEISKMGSNSKGSGEQAAGAMAGLKKAASVAAVAVAAVVTVIGAVGAALIRVGQQTLEFREETAKLNSAFQAQGKSAYTAAKAYKELYGVIGEIDTSVEAAQQIALLGGSVEDTAKWAKLGAGVVASFGDALMPETFFEAANETLRLGEATGAYTQMLEGLGQDVEAFNANLQALNTEEERRNYIYSVANELMGTAGELYRQNNADIIAYRQSQAELDSAMARTGEAVQPLMTALNNLGTAFYNMIQPVLTVVIPAISTLINWISTAIQYIATFFKVVFNVSYSTEKASTGISKVASSAGSAAKNTDKATKAIEKLKRSTMGFDELNKVSSTANQAAGAAAAAVGGAGAGAVGGGISTPELEAPDMSDWEKTLTKYQSIIQDITTWSLIGIGVLGAVLCFLGGNWVGGLAFAAMAGLGIAVGSAEGSTFDRLGDKLKNWWNSSVKPWFNEKVKPIFTKEYWKEKWENIKTATSEKLDEVKTKVSEKWQGVKDWFSEHVKPIFTKEYWKNKFNTIKDSASEKLEEAKTSINEKWVAVKEWFSKNVAPKFTKEYWSNKWNNLKTAAAEKVNEVKNTITEKWNTIKSWFNSNIAPKFTKDYWKGKFNSIKDGLKEAFNGAIGVVEKAVNSIINKINTLSWTIPEWVPHYGGDKFGFNFKNISIPRLAEGGIVTQSTLANIGENGKEAVIPLERNTEWLDMLADKLAARSAAPSRIILNVDGKELGWASINGINNITKQTGALQLQLI